MPGSDHGDEGQRDDENGERLDDVHEAREDLSKRSDEPASTGSIARHQADNGTGAKADDGGGDSDDEIDARGRDSAAEDIQCLLVRTEPVRAAGRSEIHQLRSRVALRVQNGLPLLVKESLSQHGFGIVGSDDGADGG